MLAKSNEHRMRLGIDPLVALGVVFATAATDAVYVMFTSAVVARRRVPAATWSSIWYLLSSFAVISYTNNWMYVMFCRGWFMDWRLSHNDLFAPSARPSSDPAVILAVVVVAGRRRFQCTMLREPHLSWGSC
jgi:hypothetical protein